MSSGCFASTALSVGQLVAGENMLLVLSDVICCFQGKSFKKIRKSRT